MSLLKPSVLRFKFDDFASLPSEPCESVYSRKKTDCHGNAWKIILYPGGNDDTASDDPFVGVYLHHHGKGSSVHAIFTFILRDTLGKRYFERRADQYCCFESRSSPGYSQWGYSKFLQRSKILNKTNGILVDGALIIDVHLQFMPKEECHTPPSSLSNKMLQLLESEDGADVSFKVGGEVINAHKLILRMNAPSLFSCCEDNKNGSHIPIDDTTSEIFRIVLRYAYGEEVPDNSTIETKGKEIIDGADKFGVVDLKLVVETALVKALVMNVGNAADWLVFADAKTCPLLKEQAMAFIVSQSVDILKSDASKRLKESPRLLTELMLEMAESANNDHCFGSRQDVSVGILRKRLREKGLDVDGSKEMLASRLEESNKRKRVK